MTDWQAVVSRHSGIVWQTAYRLLADHHEASDCFQDAFLGALQLSRRQEVRSWPGLLVHLATRRALDRLRSRGRRNGRLIDGMEFADLPSPEPGPVEHAQAAELSDRLRQALSHLPSQQAEVFCLRCLSELSYRDIARQLDLKGSAVGVLLHRARQRLRELLQPCTREQRSEVPS